MTAYQAILEALIGRAASGRGRHVEVSLFHAMADWMNVPYLQHRYGGATPTRQGLKHPTIAPYGVFDCADGRALLLSVQNDREWAALCRAFGAPERATAEGWATNNARVANRDAVDGFVQENLGRRDREANVALLEGARIAVGRLSEMEDVVTHPQSRFVAVETATGPIDLLAPGARVVDGPAPGFGPVPELDAQGAAIRAEFAPAAPG